MLLFLFCHAFKVLVYLVPFAAQSQFLIGFFCGAIYADTKFVEITNHVWHPCMEIFEHKAVGQYAVFDIVTFRSLVHEVPVHV